MAVPKTGGLGGGGAVAQPKTGGGEGAPESNAANDCAPGEDRDITRGSANGACPPKKESKMRSILIKRSLPL